MAKHDHSKPPAILPRTLHDWHHSEAVHGLHLSDVILPLTRALHGHCSALAEASAPRRGALLEARTRHAALDSVEQQAAVILELLEAFDAALFPSADATPQAEE